MPSLTLLSDAELLARIPAIVQAERIATADVIEHLMEVQRRRLYLEQACSSLYTYCRERLGYSEDAALKRARVAHLALRLPRVLDELRNGAIHLTGLFLLERHLNDENAEDLLTLARGASSKRRSRSGFLGRTYRRRSKHSKERQTVRPLQPVKPEALITKQRPARAHGFPVPRQAPRACTGVSIPVIFVRGSNRSLRSAIESNSPPAPRSVPRSSRLVSSRATLCQTVTWRCSSKEPSTSSSSAS